MSESVHQAQRTEKNKHILEERLGFLFELYNNGVDIGQERYQLLLHHKYIKLDVGSYDFDRILPHAINKKVRRDYGTKSDAEFAADERVDIIESDQDHTTNLDVIQS